VFEETTPAHSIFVVVVVGGGGGGGGVTAIGGMSEMLPERKQQYRRVSVTSWDFGHRVVYTANTRFDPNKFIYRHDGHITP
jgi:hypothetical protein